MNTLLKLASQNKKVDPSTALLEVLRRKGQVHMNAAMVPSSVRSMGTAQLLNEAYQDASLRPTVQELRKNG